MDRREYSLRWQLLGLISIPLILTGLIIGGFAIHSTFYEIEEVSDAQLVTSAKVLLKLTERELKDDNDNKIEIGDDANISHSYENKIAFRIWKADNIIAQSNMAKSFGKRILKDGFSYKKIGKHKWRFFVYTDKKVNIAIETAERYDIRIELIRKIIGSFFLPAVFFVPIVFLLVWFGTTKSLMPLITLSKLVDRRDTNDLTPIEMEETLPKEVTPLMVAFNQLLERVSKGLQREREFTDNAAHELRTPLAAMKTQTQVLLKKINKLENKEGLDNLEHSIDRATHMVEQLLSFARIQSPAQSFESVELSNIIQTVLEVEAPLAVNKDIELIAEIIPNINIYGNGAALSIMVRNIVDNAIKFTPRKGSISIFLRENDNVIVFSVLDSGIGIPDNKKDKAFKRFYRRDSGKTEGSGLGLSMVDWICKTHNAKIELKNNEPSGLIANVTFRNLEM